MNELARLGIAMDTKPLRDGKAALDAIVPSAQKAEKGIERFNAAAHGLKPGSDGAAAAAARLAAAAQGVTSASIKFTSAASGASNATLKFGNGFDILTGKANSAAAASNNVVASIVRVGNASTMADAHIEAYRNSLASVPAAANSAASSLNRLGAAANDNINRLQATPGNIAAQFQDIGVTAAGGMSPLLIALQQGTQLAPALQSGVGNLVAGLRQLFNMTSILTIGFVALLAAGLQMVDWMSVGKAVVNGLADGLEVLAEVVEDASVAIVYFGLVATVAFGPRILASVLALAASIRTALTGAIVGAATAMKTLILANPFGALLIGIGLVIGAMALLNDRFGGVFTNVLNIIRDVANGIIRFFAIAFNSIVQRAQSAVNAIGKIFNSVAGFLNLDVRVGEVDFSGAQVDTTPGRNFVGETGDFISSGLRSASDFARGLLPGAGSAAADAAGGAPRGQSEAERQAEAYAELVKGARERVSSLADEAAALGMSAAAARLFLNQQDLLRDAQKQGIVLDESRRETLMQLAQALTNAQLAVEIREQTNAYKEQMQALRDQSELIGLTGLELEYNATRQELVNDAIARGIIDVDNMTDAMRRYVGTLSDAAMNLAAAAEANRTAEFTADFTRNLELQSAALERSRGEIGLTGAALTAYRIESDLLNRAARENIELTPEYLEGIRQQAARFGDVTEQVRLQQQRFDDARESLRGFFGDMVSGLQRGQSVWQTFGDAVINVLNRIINRVLDSGTDSLLGSLGKLFNGGGVVIRSSEVSRLTSSAGAAIDANPELFAKGGAFSGGVQMFAKGGAFTNGIYSDPTVFKFAKGGAFGMMGEAGPEAVMPLKRGSDGSLGVRVTASEPQTVTVRVTTDDPRFNAYVDDRIGQSAPTVAQAGARISQNETAFRNTRRLA